MLQRLNSFLKYLNIYFLSMATKKLQKKLQKMKDAQTWKDWWSRICSLQLHRCALIYVKWFYVHCTVFSVYCTYGIQYIVYTVYRMYSYCLYCTVNTVLYILNSIYCMPYVQYTVYTVYRMYSKLYILYCQYCIPFVQYFSGRLNNDKVSG